MIRKYVTPFSLLIFLSMSFQVRAQSSSYASSYVDFPTGCASSGSYPCLLRAIDRNMAFNQGEQKFILSKKSSVKLIGPAEFEILDGQLWVAQSQALNFFLSPGLSLILNGDFFLQRENDHSVRVRNLAGKTQFVSKAVLPSESLPTGFENWYGGLGTDGQIQRGVIRPIEISGFLKSWLPVCEYSSAEIKKALLIYRDLWSETTEISASLYKEIIERRLASSEEKLSLAKTKAHHSKQEQNRYRQMFRERNNL